MTINQMATSRLSDAMTRLASGRRINSAADDAAGLAISEKMTAQIRSLDQATRNVFDMQNLVNTAEGALSTINDSLLRIRELTLQASNSILTDADRGLIQHEIDQLMEQIDTTARTTEFNTRNILAGDPNDPSGQDPLRLHTAADAHGRGPTVTIGNMHSSIIMGPGEYNIAEGFDPSQPNHIGDRLSRIDNAMARVNNQRTYLGAMYNRFDVTIASNQITNLNLAASRSRIADMDMALGAMQLHQQNILQQFQIQAQLERRNQEEDRNIPLISQLSRPR
jgi:flagellin